MAFGVAFCTAIGVSSASAANFDPAGTELTSTQEGTGTVTLNTGATITCTSVSSRLAVTAGSPDLATTTHGIANPVTESGCLTLGVFPTDVNTFGTWSVTAVNTTSVNATATPDATGRIVTIVITQLSCEVTVEGPITFTNNTWNNLTSTAITNSTTVFAQTVSAFGPGSVENCQTTLGTTGRIDGSITVPGASIT